MRYTIPLFLALALAPLPPALGEEEPPALSIHMLIERLADKAPEVREQAEAALTQRGKEAYTALQRAATEHAQLTVREHAQRIAARLRRKLNIWDFDPIEKAKAHLAATPRTDIGTLGGDHTEKVMPVRGMPKDAVLREVFPYHRFVQFEWCIFSGRRSPNMYAAVSIDGDVEELKAYVDWGIDDSVRQFFKQHAAVCADTEERARKVFDAYSVLSGYRGADPRSVTSARDPQGDLTVRRKGAVMTFDRFGKLHTFSAE